jgi:hypothetical protein
VTFFVKDAINGDTGSDHPEATTDILHVIEGFDIEPSKAAIYCDANGQLHGMVTKGWVECARTYSFPCWRKRGLRHQRTESSNTPLKDFSLISVDFKPVSENGSTCFRCAVTKSVRT